MSPLTLVDDRPPVIESISFFFGCCDRCRFHAWSRWNAHNNTVVSVYNTTKTVEKKNANNVTTTTLNGGNNNVILVKTSYATKTYACHSQVFVTQYNKRLSHKDGNSLSFLYSYTEHRLNKQHTEGMFHVQHFPLWGSNQALLMAQSPSIWKTCSIETAYCWMQDRQLLL